jgi:hypothetical protein
MAELSVAVQNEANGTSESTSSEPGLFKIESNLNLNDNDSSSESSEDEIETKGGD